MIEKELPKNSLRSLQERLDSIIPNLDAAISQLNYAVNGSSTDSQKVPTDEPRNATPNIGTLHSSTHELETKAREITKLVSSLLGN